ncbi:MAG: hypothetical protein KC646_00040 [Candidatus Cloacimonetes bacterium]|nr:hypothetical protein [Candidatus Cloacimonadota bacterium]
MKHSLFYISILFFILSSTLQACIWDSDTLKFESEGLPSVVDTIGGRFKKLPDSYYQFRIDRLKKQKVLSLFDYDDLAVAYDRVGNSKQAIETILLKETLDKSNFSVGERDDIHYKTLANLGTFQVHLWFRQSLNDRDDSLLDQSIDNLTKAIVINPNAHFGREKVQLNLIKWMRNNPLLTDASTINQLVPVDFLNQSQDSRKLLEALQGLVVLGEAWDSPDVFIMMSVLLQNIYKKHLSALAKLRAIELIKSDKALLLPNEIDKKDLIKLLEDNLGISENSISIVETEYQSIRKHGDSYRAALTQYVNKQITLEKHPDINVREFWKDFQEPTPYIMKETIESTYSEGSILEYSLLVLLFILGMLILKSLKDMILKAH